MPNDIRVNPLSRSAASVCSVTVSGLASAVTSAPGARPNSASTARKIAPSWPGGSRVGVPPPKKTVLTGMSAGPSTRLASRISSIARPA